MGKTKNYKFKHEIGDLLGSWSDETDSPTFFVAWIVDRGVSTYNNEPYYMIEWNDRQHKISPTDEMSVTNAKELLEIYKANPTFEYAQDFIKNKYNNFYGNKKKK